MERVSTKRKVTSSSTFVSKVLAVFMLLSTTPSSAQWQTVLTIEAEDFAAFTNGERTTDGWLFDSIAGSITDWIRFHPSATSVRISVVARGQPGGGVWPELAISFDQRCEVFHAVNSPDWTTYTFELTAPAGDRQIGIWKSIPFVHTAELPSLQVDRVEIAVAAGTASAYWPQRIEEPAFMAEPEIPATDAEVIALAESNIENHRKGDIYVRLLDDAGVPISEAPVRFQMIEHDFRWGTFAQLHIEPPLPDFESTYRQRLGELFNFATVALYWNTFEPERNQPRFSWIDAALSVYKTLDVEVKGHPLIWGLNVPPWFDSTDQAAALERLESRVRRDVSYLEGRVKVYDVVNEPLHPLVWEKWAGPDYIELALEWARQSDSAATLLINEYDLVNNPVVCDNFFLRMKNLLDDGAPLDGLGIQLHSTAGEWFTPRQIWRALERLAQLGIELHLTEFSVRTVGTTIRGGPYDGQHWTDELQAEYYAQVMKVIFGHPSM